MADHTTQSAASFRSRNRVVLVFAALGLAVPAVLAHFTFYLSPLPKGRGYTSLDRFLWSIVPYLWPSAPIVLASGSMADAILFWTISLALNALIYSGLGWILWRVGRIVARLRARTGVS